MSELFQVRCRFEIRPASELPDGKSCHVIERPGELNVWFGEPDISAALNKQLDDFHRDFFERQAMKQRWDGDDRFKPLEDAAGKPTFTARYAFADREALPRGWLCYPIWLPGVEFIWLICRGEMSPKALREMNEYLEKVIPNGGYEDSL